MDVFSEYVHKIYSIKSNPINNTQKSMAKSLLNNLLGRFGINLEKSITDVVSTRPFDRIGSMNKILSYKIISDDRILVNYVPNLYREVIESHGLYS
jgi:hypothetical protein